VTSRLPTAIRCAAAGSKPFRGVDDPLKALGVVLLGAGKPVVLCAVDWTGIRNEAFRTWRKALADAATHHARTRPHLHAVPFRTMPPFADTEAEKLIRAAGCGDFSLDLKFFDDCVKRFRRGAQKPHFPKAREFTHIGNRRREKSNRVRLPIRRIVVDGQSDRGVR